MGSDDLFKKRKARSASKLRRKTAKRAPYKKILIVCEGKKTEPLYLEQLKDYHSLSSANIEISGDCGSSPNSVCDYALQRYREEKDAGDAFDEVYCVFDKDQHTTYSSTLKKIAGLSPKNTFYAINSVPCFEYWLLLHFNYTTKPYVGTTGKSSGAKVESDLRAFLPGYQKGKSGIFDELVDQLPQAIAWSEKSGTDNPSTRMHELVEVLRDIKN